MTTAKVNNFEMAYKITGDGPPVVLIHGHPFDHTMWDPQTEALSKLYKVITPDLRGYGQSGMPVSKTHYEDYATDVLKLLSLLHIDGFHLVGLSMGGQIIMEMFRQAPNRVKTLTFADTFASLDTPAAKQARNDMADRLEKEGMAVYADEAIAKMIKPEHITSMPEVAAHVMRMMKDTNPVAAATAMRARSERIDYLSVVLPEINVPTLIIVGRDDQFTPVAMAKELQQHMNSCKLFVIDDAGHMPNLEHPEQFNKIMLDFLEDKSFTYF